MRQFLVRYVDVPIADLPASLAGLRVGHISDLHLRGWNWHARRIQHTLLRNHCDLLLVTGDLGSFPSEHLAVGRALADVFGPIRPRLGAYAVLGNHDHYRLGRQRLPIRIIRNDVIKVEGAEAPLHLVGVDQHASRRGAVGDACAELPGDGPVIVMAHFPSTAYELPRGRGALMVAGHTHGGQIRFPLVGCVWTADSIPCSMARGLHQIQGNWLHVSAGMGVAAPVPVRFLCPAEMSILTLKPAGQRRKRRAGEAKPCQFGALG